jgi:hypothetical protein
VNNRELIRAVIPTADSAKRVGAIIAALPNIKAQMVREAIGQMFRDEVIDRTGNKSDGFAYFVKRDVKLKRYATDEERKAGKVRTDADHNRRRRTQTQEERLAAWASMRADKVKQVAQHRAARDYLGALLRATDQAQRANEAAAKHEAERKATLEAQADKRKVRAAILRAKASKTKPQRLLSHTPAKPGLQRITEAPKAKVRVESVAEWMMRTGQRPDVLPVAWDQRRAA